MHERAGFLLQFLFGNGWLIGTGIRNEGDFPSCSLYPKQIVLIRMQPQQSDPKHRILFMADQYLLELWMLDLNRAIVP